MKKDFMEKEIEKRNNLHFSFEEISDKIDIDKYQLNPEPRKKFNFKRWVPVTVFVLIIAITIASIGLINRGSTGENSSSISSGGGRPGPGYIPPVVPSIDDIQIGNEAAIVFEYEKNRDFIEDGIAVEKDLYNGRSSRFSADEYTIDSQEFSSNTVGIYEIYAYLNDDPENMTSFEVEIIDDELVDITLIDYRSIYYLGEKIIPQDIQLGKIRASGEIKEAKTSEYIIDDSQFNSDVAGFYDITVYLKNSNFQATYSVEVKELEHLNLDGKYAYIDNQWDYGEPMVYAFEIIDGVFYSHYSEIGIRGQLTIDLSGNKIFVYSFGSSQTMTYNPASRILTVSGWMVGEPALSCVRLNRHDIFITMAGSASYESRYVAFGGHLQRSTINHLFYGYGGIYLDEDMKQPITSRTHFAEDATIFYGLVEDPDIDRPFIGIWYNENKKINLQIDENGVKFDGSPSAKSYSVQLKYEGIYWIRLDAFYIYQYNSFNDTISNIDDGETYGVLHRFDRDTQIIVTLNMTYNSVIRAVLESGETLKSIYFTEDSVYHIGIPGYNGDPLYEDAAFYNVQIGSNSLSDFYGIHGTVKDYILIRGSWTFNKLGDPHRYWGEIVQDYQVVKFGWVQLSGYDEMNNTYTLTLHYEDGTSDDIIYHRLLQVMQLGDESFSSLKKPWAEFDILGEYYNANSEKVTVSNYGQVYVDCYNPISDYHYQMVHGGFITYMSEDMIIVKFVYSDQKEQPVNDVMTFEKVDGAWRLNLLGDMYYKA